MAAVLLFSTAIKVLRYLKLDEIKELLLSASPFIVIHRSDEQFVRAPLLLSANTGIIFSGFSSVLHCENCNVSLLTLLCVIIIISQVLRKGMYRSVAWQTLLASIVRCRLKSFFGLAWIFGHFPSLKLIIC